ncbi:MAG: helix-turn-helix domain-containing protein [Proteobacteria bacterium]|nr:helix-turn-helix domain-containing protein [Pseudomonadota bacterium]
MAEVPVGSAAGQRPRLFCVSGAKGGVGVTFVSANLALYLASLGRRVVLVDADPGGANLHTWLGAAPPTPLQIVKRSGRAESPLEWLPMALCPTPHAGLRLLHLGFDEPGASAARLMRRAGALQHLREVDGECVVLDLGANRNDFTLDAYLGADVGLFVTVPEPTAIENTHRFVRGLFARDLARAVGTDEERKELARRLRAFEEAPPPLDLVEQLEAERHPLARQCRAALDGFRPRLLINQARLRADLELGRSLTSAVRRRYGVRIDCLGHVDHDDTVWTCLRKRRPVLVETPGAKSSRRLEKVARRLLAIDVGKTKGSPASTGSPASSVPWGSHHDVLEVERGATDEELRRAYKRSREVYSDDALCCYGLFQPAELRSMRTRLDEAFDVLLDSARRRPYELSVFPPEAEPTPRARPSRALPESSTPAPEITPDTHFTGPLLRAVRESKQIELSDIGKVTKISVTHLQSVEDDAFGLLPAPVYVHGYVSEMAKCLGLDPLQVSRTYLRRYRQYLHQRDADQR